MQAPLPHSSIRRFVSKISMAVAFVLVAAKLIAWLETGSVSLLTSAIDAFVDAAASLVTFIGVRYAERPPDDDHRFGHGKGEAIAAFMQAMFLAGAALVLAFQSLQRFIFPTSLSMLVVGIWIIAGSLCAALGLVGIQTWALKSTYSTAIAADRTHYKTDIAVNATVLLALLLTGLTGWQRIDPLFAIVISAYMILNAKTIASEALLQLLDRELPDQDRSRIKKAVLACDGVKNIHDLRTRYAGDRSFVEFHLEVDGGLSVDHGHAIGDCAEAAVTSLLPGIVEVTCHLEPFGIDDERLDNRVKPSHAENKSGLHA